MRNPQFYVCDKRSVPCPQVSVLSTILLNQYGTPLGYIDKPHNLSYRLYAGETQIYLYQLRTIWCILLIKLYPDVIKFITQIWDWLAAKFIQFNGIRLGATWEIAHGEQIIKSNMHWSNYHSAFIHIKTIRAVFTLVDPEQSFLINDERIGTLWNITLVLIVNIRQYIQ